MVNNFEFYAPTRVVFGRKTEEQTGALVRQFGGSRVLIVYGGKSAGRSGLLDTVRASLARRCLAACGDHTGSAKKLTLADMIAIYTAANAIRP